MNKVFHFIHPRVTPDSLKAKSFFCTGLENDTDKVLNFLGQPGIDDVASVHHRFLNFSGCFTLERSVSMKKFIQKYPEGPDINSIIILSSKEHLWSHILVGPAECASSTTDITSCPSEITYLDISFAIEQEIFRLDRMLYTFRSL